MRKSTTEPSVGGAPASICIVRLSALGDVINAVPIVHTLQRHWPGTALTWIVGTNEAALVGDLPGVRFERFDKGGGMTAYRHLRRTLRGRRFDVLLLMQFAFRANLIGGLVPADTKLGFDRERSREGHGLVINRRALPARTTHVVDGYFSFLESLGIGERVLDWSVPIPDTEREAMAHALPGDESTLVISPCGSSRFRDWLPARYAAVADHAASRHGYRIVLSGGPSERERALAEAIRAHMRAPVQDLVGRTSLKGMLALLERAELLVTPDSGPAHMANATRTDVIALHATSQPQRSGPYRSLDWCVNRYPEAARRFGVRDPDSLRWGTKFERAGAMELITIDDVLERFEAWRQARRAGAAQYSS